ncbi:MAG TPA: hypothetical protein DDW52_24550 [Planctomycetaceae bacterium]|nr:hypothetical protein [Planctomycetaceae bacterium]
MTNSESGEEEQDYASDAKRVPGLTHWVYAGSCKICGDGLRRVRRSVDEAGKAHYFLLCDECEAIWLSPDQRGEQQYADVESPICPITGRPLYGEHAGWAGAEEIKDLPWSDAILVTPVNSGAAASDPLESDLPGGADSDQIRDQSDPSYGQDEPRPGC